MTRTRRSPRRHRGRAAGLIAVTTLLARIAGFARILVFTDAVGTGGVGGIYQSVNAIPNVMFEIAAGGVLAAVAVPLIAQRLGRGARDRADRTASALLTWTLLVLCRCRCCSGCWRPAHLVALRRPERPAGRRGRRPCCCGVRAAGAALRVGIVLTGMLQAHRRFLAAALAPLLSSLGRRRCVPLRTARSSTARSPPSLVSDEAIRVLGLGHHARCRRAVGAADRAGDAHGLALRPALRMPSEEARRIGALGGAGIIALLAQQAAVVVTLLAVQGAGDLGTITVYTYAQAVYLLPYAVLAVPVATSAFPALAARSWCGRGRHRHAAAHPAGGARPDRALGRACSSPRRRPSEPSSSLLDARRGDGATGSAALAALPATLTAYAPGLVGFGLTALLTRALYVRGRPTDAGLAAALGWSLAALLPLVVLAGGQSPAVTLRWLGVGSTIGMTVSGIALVLLVRRTWGTEVTRGRPHDGALVVAVALAVAVGDLVTARPHHRQPARGGRPSAWRPAGPPSWWGWSRCRSATAR